MKKFMKVLKRILIVLLTVLVLLVLYIRLKGKWEKDNIDELDVSNSFIVKNDTYISAHRMGSDLFPEDTLMSAQGLIGDIEDGLTVDVIETDLQLTKDGELILLHDETLDRTTNAVEVFGKEGNKVEDHTLAELKTLNFGESFKDKEGNTPYAGLKGEDIPDNLRACTIEELLTYLESQRHFRYILEIKDDGERGIAATDKLVKLIKEMGIEDDVIVASFNQTVLSYLDEAYPECHRNASASEAVSFYVDWLLNKEAKDNHDYDILDITPHYGIFAKDNDFGINHGLLVLDSQGFINYAHECNLSVFYWTVDDKETFDYLKSVDVDGIITDDPTLND